MQPKQTPYCKLLYRTLCELKPRSPFTKTQFVDLNYLYYQEIYDRFDTLKHRITELNQEWNSLKKKRKYDGNLYFWFYLQNSWQDFIDVAICGEYGWSSEMSYFTVECINKRKQKALYKKVYCQFYCSDDLGCFPTETASEKTVSKMIKEWLDTGKYMRYVLNQSEEIEIEQYDPFEKK